MKRAWFALSLALALHVADEAANDFLGFYNPFVMMLRDVTLIQWLPTFEFGPWLAGLIAAVVVLLALGRFVTERGLAWLAIPLGALMLLNGCGHIGMSLYTQRLIPGVLSSPVLAACSVWLLARAIAKLRR
ncbi:MAG: HXXEE domain-containing protein [Acidobacteria bacterium]|nr:HXXEE domain-containing protein [Acidobacteriota bacterium]